MTAIFLVFFIIGLFLAVRVMLFGVERRTADGLRVQYWLPITTVLVSVFGVGGYLLTRSGEGSAGSAAGSAALMAVASSAVVAWLVARWARVVPEHDVEDERYVLQGHPARVVSPIDRGAPGEISFEVETEHRRLPAVALDDLTVGTDTDVVIERIEDGIAYVEPWLLVEQRL